MRHARARKSPTAAVALGLCLAATVAGCAIDKQATGENLIKDVEKTHSIKLSATGRECLQKLINSLSNDELNALNEAKASAALKKKFLNGETDCVPAIGIPANPGNSTPSTTTVGGGTTIADSSPTGSAPLDSTVTAAGPASGGGSASVPSSTTATSTTLTAG